MNLVVMAGALVLWLCEETGVQEVVGLNPRTGYLMDIFSHYIDVKIELFV